MQQVWYELSVLCLFFPHKAQLLPHDRQVEGFVCGHEFIQDSSGLGCIQLRAQCLGQASQVPAAHGRLGLVRVSSSFVWGVANEIWIKSDTRWESLHVEYGAPDCLKYCSNVNSYLLFSHWMSKQILILLTEQCYWGRAENIYYIYIFKPPLVLKNHFFPDCK